MLDKFSLQGKNAAPTFSFVGPTQTKYAEAPKKKRKHDETTHWAELE